MVIIIDRYNSHAMRGVLEEMFRMRHEIFVKRLGWTSLENKEHLERDQFDTDDAVYFCKLGPTGDMIGSCRLVPTTGPHMLADVFPYLVESGAIPRGEDIYEVDRLCGRKDRTGFYTGNLGCGMAMAGAIEWAYESGIRMLTGITNMPNLELAKQRQMDPQPLGRPHQDPDLEGHETIAFYTALDSREKAARIVQSYGSSMGQVRRSFQMAS